MPEWGQTERGRGGKSLEILTSGESREDSRESPSGRTHETSEAKGWGFLPPDVPAGASVRPAYGLKWPLKTTSKAAVRFSPACARVTRRRARGWSSATGASCGAGRTAGFPDVPAP